MAPRDVFSKRNKPLPDTFAYNTIPPKLRNQILLLWKDCRLGEIWTTTRGTIDGYEHVRNIICREHGRLSLANPHAYADQDLFEYFVQSDETEVLLDIIELAARLIRESADGGAADTREGMAIAVLNHRFRENGIGYEFEWDANVLVCTKNRVLHQEVVRPVLGLLVGEEFASANEEYLKAHRHFRHGGYGDCLTECGKAFESAMKIVCDKNGWSYDQAATARPLIQTCIQEAPLPAYFEQLLIIIATLRNRLGAHGQGTEQVDVPEHLAKYSLHATAAAIVLLVDASKDK